MSKLGTAIVGGGFIGHIHAKAVLANGGSLISVVDADRESSRRFQSEYGVDAKHGVFRDLLDDDSIELIHICTPNYLHADMVEAAVAAGKHVVCEKPLAMDFATAQKLVESAQNAGIKTGVPFVYRFYSMIREAKEWIASGEIGKINLLHGHYLQDWLLNSTDYNWRVDPNLGGASRAMGDIGVHWCDLIEFVTGERIAQVTANIATVQDRVNGNGTVQKVQSEDVVTLMFQTASGISGSVVISQVSAGRQNEIVVNIDGSKSALSFNQQSPDTLWIGGRALNSRISRGSESVSSNSLDYSFVPAGHPQGYQDCFNAFYRDMVRSIQGVDVSGFPTFSDGARAAKLTEAVLESVKSKSWIEVR